MTIPMLDHAVSVATCIRLSPHILPESTSARRDMEVLICKVLSVERASLYAWSERQLSDAELQQLKHVLIKRIEGQPIAYLLGEREFWSLPLIVSPDTLIPRPETEQLVEACLEHLRSKKAPHILDLGTGSGAIALAIASEREDAQVLAVDTCEKALAVAKQNKERLGFSQVRFLHSMWFEKIHNRFDAIVSNPPYIDADDPHLQCGDVRFEPANALISAQKGLADITSIIAMAYAHLNEDGWLGIEHGAEQGGALRALMTSHGYKGIRTLKDLAGHDRITEGVGRCER